MSNKHESFILEYINNYPQIENFFYDGMILYQSVTKIQRQNVFINVSVRNIEILINEAKKNGVEKGFFLFKILRNIRKYKK